MRPFLLALLILTLSGVPAGAQSTTEDGIRALLRGDDQAAAHILRPLADDLDRPDPVAQFFLAIMYDTGHGVRADDLRACGLFQRAAVPANPFENQSAALSAAIQENLGGPAASSLCVANERWRGGPPQSFDLGPGRRIVFTDDAITVTDGDLDERTPIRFSSTDVDLPVQHTALAVTQPVVATRHFFQLFSWTPDSTSPSSWSLNWALTEVVAEHWMFIAHEENLLTVEGAAPPAQPDVGRLVRLAVNAGGAAEYVVTTGASSRTNPIPWKGGAAAPNPAAVVPSAHAAPSEATSQSPTADGVIAIARGDYTRAAEILRPLAENWRKYDPAAGFFMAGLYDAGLGVSADPVRACALYFLADGSPNNPFAAEATHHLLRASMLSGGADFIDDCQALARTGLDNRFEPAIFDLGPQHSVSWTLAASTVTYRDRVKREPTQYAVGGYAVLGTQFLPLRQTDLLTGPTRSVTRHFVEIFLWQPASGGVGQSWNLHWIAYEIVRDEAVVITASPDPLVTVDGDAPPPSDSFDVHEYARLDVDENGNAEAVVLTGPHPGTQPIETDAERQEVRDQDAARAAALKAVDWTQSYDVTRPPSMRDVDSDGCGNMRLYGWSADRAEAVVIDAKSSALGLNPQPAMFDLSRDSANIGIVAYVYRDPQRRFDFCSDYGVGIGPGDIAPEEWHAIAGTIAITLSPPGILVTRPYLRRATVTLTGVVLRNSRGKTIRVAGPITLSGLVGGMFG